MTDDNDVIAAAVLHEVIDTGSVEPAELRAEFGERICSLVLSNSENERPDLKDIKSWKPRIIKFTDYLQTNASEAERIITLSDKLSTLRGIWRRYQIIGDSVWEMDDRQNKEMQEWYYKFFRDVLGRLQDTEAWKEFSALIDKVFDKKSDAIEVDDVTIVSHEQLKEDGLLNRIRRVLKLRK